eukprot:m.110459 g.110459  ORF g.110459 m.110459 type:complete len:293 (-) comp14039_c2_seq3:1008-1886(-)
MAILFRVFSAGTACVASVAAYSVYTSQRALHTQTKHSNEYNLFDTNDNKRRAIIIGAGVVGVSIAYALNKRGVDVVVLDASSGPGKECSAVSAGGMMRVNHAFNIDSWKDAMTSLIPVLSAIRTWQDPGHFAYSSISNWFSTFCDPHMLRWLYEFTRASIFPDAVQNTRATHMLNFTDWAINATQEVLEKDNSRLGEYCGHNKHGALALKLEYNESDETKTQNRGVVIPCKFIINQYLLFKNTDIFINSSHNACSKQMRKRRRMKNVVKCRQKRPQDFIRWKRNMKLTENRL